MLGLVSALATALTTLLLLLLLLALTRQLWSFRWSLTRDRRCELPLPKGSMGWPLVGETFQWLFQGSNFHISRRKRHGNVFKTHLLGKPLVRVTGAENIRKILLGEHSLVCTQWPQSTRIILGPNALVNSIGELHKRKRKILAKVFSRKALESYLPRLQEVIKSEIAKWCAEPGSVDVYAATRSLTFRIAIGVLLGLHLEEERIDYLAQIFGQLMSNLFSLPIDAPFSGLRKGIKARKILHANMEKIIEKKMERQQEEEEYRDAFDYMLSTSKEQGQQISIQELKACGQKKDQSTNLLRGTFPQSQCHASNLSLDKLNQLHYIDCVIKEVLRFLPPVSGGYRTALQTFELDGYQIPKGWTVMYSIRDTHETAEIFQNPELFDPDRFVTAQVESRSSRFSYVPFGGGVRSCVGKELAQIILKTLTIELIRTCKWTLATEKFPKMQTVPIVHPVNGLHVNFMYKNLHEIDH
ncbi:cytochrome P450 26C1 isoform X2 [Takifugu rubripes]|uniref:cytochrome P450 26C1 isoform X2 n=1 Tax=Takifugu rubripes TaxID=31033 RepID=UPI00114587F9|nr:cytochrome P450 26B1 isoform X2 [Takifugu rubripes]XP_056903770.1 cytochrome P450 26B1 isoform X2 [Takifugu flavidus]